MRQRNTIRVAVFIVILLQGVEVQASGFLLSKFGGDLGYPTSFGAVSVFWNPAAMAYRPETSILLEHTLLYRRIDYDRKAPIVDDPSNTGVGRLRNWLQLPYLGAKSNFGLERVAFGVAAYPPFGMRSVWEHRDGPQRWQLINGNLTTWYATGAVGVKLPWNLYIGGSVSYTYTAIETVRAVSYDLSVDDSGGTAVTYVDDPAKEGRGWVDVDDHGVAYGVGVLWVPVPEVRVGLSYLSRLTVNAEGSLRQADRLGNVKKQEATLDGTFPDAIHFGAEYTPVTGLDLRLGVSWVHWSVFDRQILTVKDGIAAGTDLVRTLPRAYRDSWIIRGGAKYRFLNWLDIYVGGGWDQSPIPPKTLEPSLFDLDKFGFSFGAVFYPWEHMVLTIGYNHVFHLREEVKTSVLSPPSNGTYEAKVDILHTSMELRF